MIELIILFVILIFAVKLNKKANIQMALTDDLKTELINLKTELDAAKDRDSKIQSSLADVQKQLADLIANPPAGPDLSEALQSVKDDIAEAQSIGQPATPPPMP